MSIYIKAVAFGCEIKSHESDLYLKKDEVSDKLVREYPFKNNVTTFTSQVDHQIWYNIPFAYDPYWEKVRPKTVKEKLITEILQVCAVSNVVTNGKCPVDGSLFFSLLQLDEIGLYKIAAELNINTSNIK